MRMMRVMHDIRIWVCVFVVSDSPIHERIVCVSHLLGPYTRVARVPCVCV